MKFATAIRKSVTTVATCAAILSAVLVRTDAAEAASPTNRSCDAIVSVSLTNVRTGPGLDYDVITQLPLGTAITAIGLDLNAKWYIVYLPSENNVEARWIYRRNMRVSTNCVKALVKVNAGASGQ